MEQLNGLVKIESESTLPPPPDLELMPYIQLEATSTSDYMNSFSVLSSTDLHTKEYTTSKSSFSATDILSCALSKTEIKSEPMSPSFSRESSSFTTIVQASSSFYTPCFTSFSSEFTNDSVYLQEVHSPQLRPGDLDWLHTFKLPASLSDTLLCSNNEYAQEHFVQQDLNSISQFLPCTTSHNYVNSFKFEHREKPKKPRTKYTKEHVSWCFLKLPLYFSY